MAFMQHKAASGSTQSVQQLMQEWSSQQHSSSLSTAATTATSRTTEHQPKTPSQVALTDSSSVSSISHDGQSTVAASPKRPVDERNSRPATKKARTQETLLVPSGGGLGYKELAKKMLTKHCTMDDHRLQDLIEWEPRDFYPTSIADGRPGRCCDCHRSLDRMSKDPKTHCLFRSNVAKVRMCPNADHKKRPGLHCKFALCHDCHTKLYNEMSREAKANGAHSPRRKRRRI